MITSLTKIKPADYRKNTEYTAVNCTVFSSQLKIDGINKNLICVTGSSEKPGSAIPACRHR